MLFSLDMFLLSTLYMTCAQHVVICLEIYLVVLEEMRELLYHFYTLQLQRELSSIAPYNSASIKSVHVKRLSTGRSVHSTMQLFARLTRFRKGEREN